MKFSLLALCLLTTGLFAGEGEYFQPYREIATVQGRAAVPAATIAVTAPVAGAVMKTGSLVLCDYALPAGLKVSPRTRLVVLVGNALYPNQTTDPRFPFVVWLDPAFVPAYGKPLPSERAAIVDAAARARWIAYYQTLSGFPQHSVEEISQHFFLEVRVEVVNGKGIAQAALAYGRSGTFTVSAEQAPSVSVSDPLQTSFIVKKPVLWAFHAFIVPPPANADFSIDYGDGTIQPVSASTTFGSGIYYLVFDKTAGYAKKGTYHPILRATADGTPIAMTLPTVTIKTH